MNLSNVPSSQWQFILHLHQNSKLLNHEWKLKVYFNLNLNFNSQSKLNSVASIILSLYYVLNSNKLHKLYPSETNDANLNLKCYVWNEKVKILLEEEKSSLRVYLMSTIMDFGLFEWNNNRFELDVHLTALFNGR